MKFKRKYLVTLGVLMLSGCVDLSPVNPNETTSSAVTETTNEAKVNVMEEHQQTTAKKQQLQQLIAKRFEAIEKMSMNLQVSIIMDEQQYIVNQKTEEQYEKGQLKGYLVSNQIDQDSTELKEQIYYTGNEYFYRFNSNAWKQLNGDTKSSILYISLIKYLFEGNDEWEVKETDKQMTITRNITDEALLKVVPQLFSLPMMVSKNAQIEMNTQYQVNPDNGDITHIVLNADIDDLGSKYSVKIESDINSKAEFKDWQIDTNQKVSLDASRTDQHQLIVDANPYQAFNYVETYRDDQSNTTLTMGNYLNGQPISLIEGQLQDQDITDLSFWKDNHQYQETEATVEKVEVKKNNLYAQFVQRVDEQYDQLVELEATEDSPFITLREFFEQDYEQFVVGLTELDKEIFNTDNSVYGIDYLINKDTFQLMGVILWSAAADTAEIGPTVTLNFDNFNAFNPSLLMNQVSDKILEKINE